MADSSSPSLLIDLTSRTDNDQVVVSLKSFLRFAEEISFGLEDLVERWQHIAAPAARLGAVRQLLEDRD